MFEPMLAGAIVGGVASWLSLIHHYRQQLGPMTAREARQLVSLPRTPIAEAQSGLVKIVGTVGADVVENCSCHSMPCAALEILHYSVVDTLGGARRTLARIDRKVHPFWVQDESGRVAIDPSRARIDFEAEGADLEGSVEERWIRVGERVTVLGHVRYTEKRLTQPMRQAALDNDYGIELLGVPLVTWRSEPEVYPRLAPPFGGVALSAGSLGLAVLGAILNLPR